MAYYTCLLASFNHQTEFAETKITDHLGNPTTGIYCLQFGNLHVKYLKDFSKPKGAVLCSSIFSSFQVDLRGQVVQRFSPLKIVELQGEKGDESAFDLSTIPVMYFSDKLDSQWWLQSLDRKKTHGIEFNVQFFVNKK